MLTKNMPELRLVNGSRGVAVDFEERSCDGVYGVSSGVYRCPVVQVDSPHHRLYMHMYILPRYILTGYILYGIYAWSLLGEW